MPAKSDKKKEILLKSFDVIKDNFDQNKESIRDAVSKMLAIDEEIAKEMWFYLLDKYDKELKGEYGTYLSENIIYYAKDHNNGKYDEMILGNPKIKNAMFSHGTDDDDDAYPFYESVKIIYRRVIDNDYSTADELLNMLKNNKYHKIPWHEFMSLLIDEFDSDEELSDEAYDLLNGWCNKVRSKEEKAKLSIKLLDLM